MKSPPYGFTKKRPHEEGGEERVHLERASCSGALRKPSYGDLWGVNPPKAQLFRGSFSGNGPIGLASVVVIAPLTCQPPISVSKML